MPRLRRLASFLFQPSLEDDKAFLQHQLHLAHAELIREDARKRAEIRHELVQHDALQSFLRTAKAHLGAA